MLISLNAIKKHFDFQVNSQELIDLIGSRLVEIEEVHNLAPKYRKIYIVKVIACQKIPDTHLSLCQIDNGKQTLQVICGAPNVHQDMFAAWIAPGAIVPSTYDKENFQISVRKIRGYESHGMLASAAELDLGHDHDGIIEIDPKLAQPGTPFAEAFDLNDTILDVENKSLTQRPDTFGLIGFAREIAGILGQKFSEPQFLNLKDPNFTLTKRSPLSIKITDPALCPRYTCAVIDFTNLPTEQKYFTPAAVFLAKSGMRSISPIVDLTNILMLETGQPLHAFDYDKFVKVGKTKSPKIIVRPAKAGEKITLLDGEKIICHPHDILITSNNVPVALAGAMGGLSTAIDQSTQKIILESATFSLYNLRKTQMTHGIFSEAITRFTKGQPAFLTLPVLSEALSRLQTHPLAVADAYPLPIQQKPIKLTTKDVNQLLGTNYSAKLIKTTLENVGFQAQINRQTLTVTAPLWRTDIQIQEDITEEVGRLLGYDNIPLTLPTRSLNSIKPNIRLTLKTQLRNILSDRLGAHEVLTYSFVSQALLDKVGQRPQDSYQIINSISPELQYFRQAIIPSLLDKIRENQKAGFSDFSLYEINQVTTKTVGLNSEKVPIMFDNLGLVTIGDYYHVKSIISHLSDRLKLDLSVKPLDKNAPTYFEPAHSAHICCGKTKIGIIGAIKASVLAHFKLTTPISALEINLDSVLELPRHTKPYANLSRFPYVERDLTFRITSSLNFEALESAVKTAFSDPDLIFDLTPTSIYQAKNHRTTKNITFHLKCASLSHTLQPKHISAIIDNIKKSVEVVGAELI